MSFRRAPLENMLHFCSGALIETKFALFIRVCAVSWMNSAADTKNVGVQWWKHSNRKGEQRHPFPFSSRGCRKSSAFHFFSGGCAVRVWRSAPCLHGLCNSCSFLIILGKFYSIDLDSILQSSTTCLFNIFHSFQLSWSRKEQDFCRLCPTPASNQWCWAWSFLSVTLGFFIGPSKFYFLSI